MKWSGFICVKCTDSGDRGGARRIALAVLAVLSVGAEAEVGQSVDRFSARRDVAAGRQSVAACPDPAALAREALALVNALRAEARACGGRAYPAVAPLLWSETLRRAAAAHAQDMAQGGYFDHRAPTGETPGDRLARAGYAWQAQGETLAVGTPNAAKTVAAWLSSPPHCETLMQPRFREVALACAENGGRLYWTLEAAARRR